jgi:fumarate reductase subunit C
MAGPIQYSPKTFRARVSTYWWLDRWVYLRFILRELSSIFVAWFVVLTLLQITALRRGATAYMQFQGWLRSPFLVALNLLSFFFVIFHAVTWFNLAPKAMALRAGGKRLPGALIVMPSYVAWLAISAAVAWMLLRG